jgi:protein-L-isoaspartate(D-aspartate) O-methyltransferase
MSAHESHRQRTLMVSRDIVGRGITDSAVIDAMSSVERERFLDPQCRADAYADSARPIGEGQTMSQPYIVALMIASAGLAAEDRVLEVGTGSGYGAAVLSQVVAEVCTIERHPALAAAAAGRLAALGIDNVEVVVGDGSVGRPDRAPFDAILVTAAGPAIPDALVAQLVDGGRLIMPVGDGHDTQRLVRVVRHGENVRRDDLGPVRFVPLIGSSAWPLKAAEGEPDEC